jgi:H/ACA ribonucleoprotein complex subunit 4
MAELRRTQAGPFQEKDNLITLNDLQDAYHYYTKENNPKYLHHCLQPIENAITHLSKCWILDTTITSVSHGRPIAIPGIAKLENFRKGEIIAVLTLKEELVCIGESLLSAVEINTKDKGLAIKVSKVFIEELFKETSTTKPKKTDQPKQDL